MLTLTLMLGTEESGFVLTVRAARRCRNSSNLVLAAEVEVEAAVTIEAEAVAVDLGGVIPVDDFAADLGGVVAVDIAVAEEEVPISRRKRSSSSRVKFRFRTADARTKIPHFSGHSK